MQFGSADCLVTRDDSDDLQRIPIFLKKMDGQGGVFTLATMWCSLRLVSKVKSRDRATITFSRTFHRTWSTWPIQA